MKNNDAYGSREMALDHRIEQLEASEAGLFKVAMWLALALGLSLIINLYFLFR